MMMATHRQVLEDLLGLLTELPGDWEYTGDLDTDTRLLGDLALESLDLVVLGTTIQERYGRLPFSDFLAEIGRRPLEERDITVGELVAFVCRHSTKAAVGGVA